MKTSLILISLLFSSLTHASTFTGKIEKLIIGRSGHQVYVDMKDAPQTCGRDHGLGFNYAFSTRDHEAGKELLSAMLAAQMSDRNITIQGNGQCTIDIHMEDVGYIYTY